jgi:hypothetical protein
VQEIKKSAPDFRDDNFTGLANPTYELHRALIEHNLSGKPLHTFPDHALVALDANLPPRSKSPTFATVRTTLVIVERNPGVRLEARFALAAEHPDHDADERSDKN